MYSRRQVIKAGLGGALGFGGLAALRFRERLLGKGKTREELTVGFLPVTCHLTCPVTDFATRTSERTRFVSQRFTDFPTLAETFKSGRIHAAFFIVPLAMKLREQGIASKITYLGHRDGSTVIVQKESDIHSLADLRNKTVAIPSKFSNQYLVMTKLLADQQIDKKHVNFVEIPPPEMPNALAGKSIDAYFVGEPHCARAELDGTGRVLAFAKDIWPGFISCALVVSEKIIQERRDVVVDLVRGIAQSGEWAETHREEAAKLVAPYFRQEERLLRHALTQPLDRVSYRRLAPTDEELGAIRDAGIRAGILTKPTPIAEVLDRSFIPKDIRPATIDTTSKQG